MNWKFLADLGERVARTFAEAYLGAWLSRPLIGGVASFDTLFTVDNLKLAVVTSVLALAAGLGLKPIGNRDSASVLPPKAQPPAPQPTRTANPASAGATIVTVPWEQGLTSDKQFAALVQAVREQIQPVAPPPAPPMPPPPSVPPQSMRAGFVPPPTGPRP